MSVTLDLSGQTAVVTGASRGIGRAIATLFGKAGASVVLFARNEGGLQETAHAVREAGGQAHVYPVDLRDGEALDTAIKQVIADHGRIDILVNNAGITRDQLLLRMSDEDWQEVIDVNLTGMFRLTKRVARLMLKQRYGRIVNITSVIGLIGNAGQANYAASKAGIIGFTKSVARELASRGITVNAIAPGFVETPMTAELDGEAIKAQIPLARMGTSEEVANTCLYLASPLASYVTGEVIRVDGGLAM